MLECHSMDEKVKLSGLAFSAKTAQIDITHGTM